MLIAVVSFSLLVVHNEVGLVPERHCRLILVSFVYLEIRTMVLNVEVILFLDENV